LLKFFKEFNDKITKVKLKGSIYERNFYEFVRHLKSHQTLNLEYLKIIRNDGEKIDCFEGEKNLFLFIFEFF
jgi:type I restriction-modification system DNA methylase subunit